MRKAIELVFKLMNENRKNTATLAIMIYELSEKRFYAKKKLNEKSFAKKNLENDAFNEKSKEKSLNDNLTIQSNIMKRIEAIYFDDVILQRIMKNKRNEQKRISINITKIEIKLKLKNCEIKKNLFYVKNRIYVLQNEKLQTSILQLIHENLSKEHVDRATTYDKLNRYYYWSKMTNTIFKYVKKCYHCKKTQHYLKKKKTVQIIVDIESILSAHICKLHNVVI